MDKIKTPKEEPKEETEEEERPMTVEEYQRKWDQILQDTAKQIDQIRENELRRSNNNQNEQR
ncbi:uncharacterized protein N7479_007098 [Penicillium vulpinum]|uniref:uncharacterized protein n=1 Tax=Penicillium vulpinum TaxID=29845 RepID=UPI002546E5C6|nr:uncharacterized protein N7479_007098 [Penicillium vulpinum]KAJ5959948.1 hypothetical protein N7479_007098 [Penicillium vulpinum]